MTRIQAEICPGILLRPRNVRDEDLAQQALIEVGSSFSSRVESTCPGTIVIDLTGTGRLMGSPQKIGTKILDRCETSFCVNIGLAANPDTALHAARGFSGVTVVPVGEEAQRLGRLPIAVMDAAPEVLDTLDSWGIKTLQALAALPSVPLAQRLGQAGLHLQQLARGRTQRELVPAELPSCLADSVDLEEAIELLEPLGFVLNRLLEQLCRRLLARSLATDEVHVDLGLEIQPDRQLHITGGTDTQPTLHQTKVKLPVPTQDVRVLFKLLQLELAAHPPHAAVKRIAVAVLPVRLRTTQTGLFQPRAPEAAALEITLGRLRAVVGENDREDCARVGFPSVTDSHRPDSFAVLPSFAPAQASLRMPSGRNIVTLAMRAFRPPLPATVEVVGQAPSWISFNRVIAKVKHASGPWRCHGEWWSQKGEWKREEWDIGLAAKNGVVVYRVFEDGLSARWFVAGMYD
jgi:protein ImuB